MGVTTRAAAQQQRSIIAQATAQLAHNRLLNLPDAVLERILVAASDGGEFRDLRSARRACSRLHAVSYAAARALTVSIDSELDLLSPLEALPRFGALTRLQLKLESDDGLDSGSDAEDVDFLLEQADEVAQAVYK